MADSYTPNYNLKKPDPNSNYNVGDQSENMNLIDAAMKAIQDDVDENAVDYSKLIPYAGLTEGSVNAYTIAAPEITTLVAGMAISAKIHIASTGASTLNWSGTGAKSIIKPGGGSPNLKAGIYTFRYDGANFQLLGEGGEYGTATADKVRVGSTIGTESGIVPGTEPDNGPTLAETINLTAQNQEYTIAVGFHSGLRKIKAVMTGLAAGIIAAGQTAGGILGTFTADATATAARILTGYSAYVNGVKINGSMANNPDLTSTLQITGSGKPTKAISAGYSPAGTITAELAPGAAPYILQGHSYGGVDGSLIPAPTYSAGNVVLNTIAAGTDTFSGNNVLVKFFKTKLAGTVRIKYSFHQNDMTTYPTVTAQVYRNGVAVGTLHSYASPMSYIEFTDDIPVSIDDEIGIYFTTTAGSYGYQYKDVKFCVAASTVLQWNGSAFV